MLTDALTAGDSVMKQLYYKYSAHASCMGLPLMAVCCSRSAIYRPVACMAVVVQVKLTINEQVVFCTSMLL